MKRIKKNKEAMAKVAKKPVKKEIDPKAVIKDISARGKKMFLTNRKTVSGFKKLTKSLAKLLTEANQTGDQKLVGRITKLFGYLGFNTDSDANKVSWCFDAKVKPMKAPKVKDEKTVDDKKKKLEKKTRKPRKPRDEKKPVEQPTQPAGDGYVPPVDGEPSPEELEKLDNERSPEVLAGDSTDLANAEETGSVDESEDDEDDSDDDEDEADDEDEDAEDQEPPSYEDGLAEFRREAWGNGDFERDDI